MKLLNSSEMRRLDQETFEAVQIPSRVIMESAGRAVADFIELRFLAGEGARLESSVDVLVVCGKGNNGGDGYVVARVLQNRGYRVRVVSVEDTALLSGDALLNEKSWRYVGGEVEVFASGTTFAGARVIVDAIFGTGFRGSVDGPSRAVIQRVNALSDRVPVIAIDIASGVETDSGAVSGEAIRASVTVALQHLKIGHVLFPGTAYGGEIAVADIGIWNGNPLLKSISRELLTDSSVRAVLRSRYPVASDSHKGVRGHVLVVGGSRGLYGAPQLSAEAALLSGAGLVTVGLPSRVANRGALAVRELMTLSLGDDDGGVGDEASEVVGRFVSASARGRFSFVLGPGLGGSRGARKVVREVILSRADRNTSFGLVLDADALNIVAEEPELVQRLDGRTVLTPHPGEMGRLLKQSAVDIQADRIGAAVRLSAEARCWVVLKGARTIIASPEGGVQVAPAVAECLGTAGSGDVLSGVIGAFLARGFSPEEAIPCGVFCHGRAGERFGGGAGITARRIARQVPLEINKLLAGEKRRSTERANLQDEVGYSPSVKRALLRFQ